MVNLQANGLTVDSNSSNILIAATLQDGGGGGLTKIGSGTLTVSASNSYVGGTTISNGILLASNASALGTGTVTLSGGTLGVSGVAVSNNVAMTNGALYGGSNGLLAGVLGGSSGLTKVGSGMLTISGQNTYSGPTMINAGTLQLAGNFLSASTKVMPVGDSITYGTNGSNAGYRSFLYSDLTAAGNTFQFVGTSNGNPGTLPTSPVNQTYHDGWPGWTTGNILGTNPVSGDGNITTWLPSLSGSSQAPTVITMMIGTNDAASGVAISTALRNVSQIINTAFSDDPSVRFLLAQLTPRTDNLADNTWVNSYNAALVTLVAQDKAAGDNIALVNLNTNFPSNGLSADGLHPNDTGYSWMASQWSAAILAGQSTSSSTAIPLNSPVTVAAGATFDLAGNPATIGSLSGAGSVTLGSYGGLTVNSTSGNSSTFSGSISGAVGITKTGPATLTLNGSNYYSGATTINAGTLALAGSGSIASSSIVSIASGAKFDVTAVSGGYAVPAGQTITGAGTVSVGSGNAFTLNSGAAIGAGSSGVGALTVNGGTLAFNTGSAMNFGATAPGVNSLLNVTGVLNLASSGIGVNIYQAGTTSPFDTDGT